MYLDTHVEGHNNVMLRSQSSQRCYWIIRHKVISVSQHFAKFPETLSSTFIDRFARCLLEKLPPPTVFLCLCDLINSISMSGKCKCTYDRERVRFETHYVVLPAYHLTRRYRIASLCHRFRDTWFAIHSSFR